MKTWDLTCFCWRITEANKWGIRLTVYVAPGLATELAHRFAQVGVSARAKSKNSVVVCKRAAIERALELLAAPVGLLQAVRQYHGRQGDRAALRQVLYFDGLRTGREGV